MTVYQCGCPDTVLGTYGVDNIQLGVDKINEWRDRMLSEAPNGVRLRADIMNKYGEIVFTKEVIGGQNETK